MLVKPKEDGDDEKKKWRWQSKLLFLTYSQSSRAGVTKQHVLDKLLLYGVPLKYIIAQEKHQEGGFHIHVLWHYKHRPNFRCCRALDVTGPLGTVHPSWAAVLSKKGGWSGLRRYLTVECSVGDKQKIKTDLTLDPEPWCHNLDEIEVPDPEDVSHSMWPRVVQGYQMKKQMALAESSKPVPWPIYFNSGYCHYFMTEPKFDVDNKHVHVWIKQRSWWICGDPDWGKTEWLVDTTSGCNIFMCAGDPDVRWEGYNNQQLVVFNDCHPTWGDLSALDKVAWHNVPFPGRTRYGKSYFQRNSVRSFIVLTNKTIDEVYTAASLIPRVAAIKRRFVEIKCNPAVNYSMICNPLMDSGDPHTMLTPPISSPLATPELEMDELHLEESISPLLQASTASIFNGIDMHQRATWSP